MAVSTIIVLMLITGLAEGKYADRRKASSLECLHASNCFVSLIRKFLELVVETTMNRDFDFRRFYYFSRRGSLCSQSGK